MRRRNRHRTWLLRLLAVAVAGAVVVSGAVWLVGAGPTEAAAARRAPSLTDWIEKRAEAIGSADPEAPLDDLAGVRGMVGDAAIVGLGEPGHGAREVWQLKHRVVRLLVEELGFRSIAWETDWAAGLAVDEYLLTGEGDPEAIVREEMETTWHAAEVADVLRWLREYNAGHEGDMVRFVGVEFFAAGLATYDAVQSYVAEAAPEQLPALAERMELIRPQTDDTGEHLRRYFAVDDKQPWIRAARGVYELVKSVPHEEGDAAWELAVQHARQILSFYEYHSLQDFGAQLDYRDARAAQNVRWWRQHTGDKVAYWAAVAHTASAPVTYTDPGSPEASWESAGAHLRRWYGKRYVSVGFAFDHGEVNAGFDEPPFGPEPVEVPPPAAEWAEAPLGEIGLDQFALDLRHGGPPAAEAWLHEPATTRLIGPGYDPEQPFAFTLTGGSLAQWYDVIVHRQKVSPWQPL